VQPEPDLPLPSSCQIAPGTHRGTQSPRTQLNLVWATGVPSLPSVGDSHRGHSDSGRFHSFCTTYASCAPSGTQIDGSPTPLGAAPVQSPACGVYGIQRGGVDSEGVLRNGK
jgi:hypothetical protein